MEWTRDEFADAVTRHSRRMYRAARSVLDSGADAEDAVSQAVLQAWQSLDGLKNREAVRPWLVKIAVNCAYAQRRRQGRVVYLDDLPQEPAARETICHDGLWEAVCALPGEFLFLNYLRCHDDIGWGLDYPWLRERFGADEVSHKKYLNDYFTGKWPGSPARGELYNDAPRLGDARLCGTTASLCGLEAADGETAPSLAGNFRDDYLPLGDLKLYLLGMREFSGRSGYAGAIYYFWERDARQFYTFTHVRPTFYEKEPRRRSSPAVPWGLPCPLHQAWNHALDLTNAKATRTGNLSASEQCQAILLDRCDPGCVYPKERVCADFALLLERHSAPHTPERDRLAVVRPQRCEPQPYDAIQQRFALRLLDGAGRDLWLEVRYKKEESKVVDVLEEFADSLKKDPRLSPVFFGIVYREGDRLKLYPIEFFTKWGEDT